MTPLHRLTVICLFLLVSVYPDWSLTTHSSVVHADAPNIVMILVDDMGYGDAQCYNPDSKIPTPNINQLARDGMRFTDAHAAGPLCHMSRYGLMTGRFPFRTDVSRWPQHPLIEANQTTIASLLSNSNYETAMVGKWHLGFEENGYDQPLPGGPVDRGFHSFFGIRASTDIPPYFYIRDNRAVSPPTARIEARNTKGWSNIQGEFWRAGGIAPGMELKDVLPRFTDEAISVIEQHGRNSTNQPLFLYLAYPAPHTPWLPEKAFRGKSGAGMYGEFTMMVDHMIGRVLNALKQADMADDTLVIFSSDNGPVWYENDVERFDHDSSGGLRGMKADAWECGHRMPFIVRWPGKVKPGTVNDRLICFTDLLATFGDLVGTNLSRDAGPDSISFYKTLLGQSEPDRPTLVIKSGSGAMTARQGPWKLITRLGSGGFSKPSRIKAVEGGPAGQLYNLDEDIGELNNLYQQKPDVVARLSAELQRIQSNRASRLPENQQ
ncbi:MAG: sulfatase family protein [Rubripirellula sp.]